MATTGVMTKETLKSLDEDLDKAKEKVAKEKDEEWKSHASKLQNDYKESVLRNSQLSSIIDDLNRTIKMLNTDIHQRGSVFLKKTHFPEEAHFLYFF